MPSTTLTFECWIDRQVGERDRYRIERLIGSGGMGGVFLAKDTQLGKNVALKLLRMGLADEASFRKRFEREIKICAALENQHIVRIDDYGITEEGCPFFVMEYLSGETLAQRLEREKKVSVANSIEILSQICRGLKVAHTGVRLWQDGQHTEPIKIIHRDLKPENIFLVPSELMASGELVKVLDFGIAKIKTDEASDPSNGKPTTQITEHNAFIGTFEYASPEQCQSNPEIDERSDIYSLGLILYRMLSGTDPFGITPTRQYVSGVDWAVAHATKKPVRLRTQPNCADLDPELEAIVEHCLAKSPEGRFSSVEELLQALKTLGIETKPQIQPSGTQLRPLIQPPTSSPAQPSRTWPKKVAALGLGVIGLLGGGYGLGQWRQNHLMSEVGRLQEQSQFEQCMRVASEVPRFFAAYRDAQVALNACRLNLAREQARDGVYSKAVSTLQAIPKEDPSFPMAQRLTDDWTAILIEKGFDVCEIPNHPLCPDPPPTPTPRPR
jgi:serine/threonine protein kinase